MTKIAGNVTGQIFTFSELKEKLRREITRLKEAEERGDSEDALDHALNAAFTAYHLVEWQEKDRNPTSQAKARDLLLQSSNSDLNLLHDVVTNFN